MNNPWKTLKSNEIYDSPWIKLTHHDVLNPAGNEGTYSVVHFKKLAIGIVPLDEQNNTWIVGQYRYPLHAYSWEIPEGGGDRNTAPLESARRELLEECGIVAANWRLIQELQLSNSATDEVAYLYVATGLSFQESNPDEDEQLVVRKLPFEELYEMVIRGEVTDAMSVAAVLKIKLMLQDQQL